MSYVRIQRPIARRTASLTVLLFTSWCFAQSPPQQVPIEGAFAAPRWSPDGQMLAVTTSNHRGIYIVKPDGSGLRQITNAEKSGFGFAWSADSKKIAFKSSVRSKKGYLRSLNVATMDGSVQTLVQHEGDMGVPTWLTADSIGLAIDQNAVVLGLDGKVKRQKTAGIVNALSWINSGNNVLFTEEDRVVMLDEKGAKRFFTDEKDGRFYNPVVSPNGGQAVVHNLNGHLYLIDLTKGGCIDLGEGLAASWSPDGKRIVCNVSTDDGHNITSSDIILIDVKAKTRKQITNTADRAEMYAAWAPDGARIAYGDEKTGSIFVHAIEGGAK